MSENNNRLQVSGNVHYLSGPIQIPNNNGGQPYTKCLMVLNIAATSDKGNAQLVQFETFGNTSSCLDGLMMGSFVTVHFNLNGRQGKPDQQTNMPKFWNTLRPWKVEGPHQNQNNNNHQQQPQSNGNSFPMNNNGGYQQQPQNNQQYQQQQPQQQNNAQYQNNNQQYQQQPSAPANQPQQGQKRDMSADVPPNAFQAPPAMPSYQNDMADDIPFMRITDEIASNWI
jgi:hypothetical protein